MFHQRLRQQRLESEADSKWLQQEEQNIELPFSPVRNKLVLVILGFLFVINDHQSKKKNDYQSICSIKGYISMIGTLDYSPLGENVGNVY